MSDQIFEQEPQAEKAEAKPRAQQVPRAMLGRAAGVSPQMLQVRVAQRLARKPRDNNGVAEGADQAVAEAASSSGQPLPQALQRKFEGSLGVDLSGVRVHTGEQSASAAEAVSARAYTLGQDIHFGRGQYDPGSEAGQHLLAHEVAHTVQQGGGAAPAGPQYKLEVSAPGDAHEMEADRAADAMVRGEAFGVHVDRQIAARQLHREATQQSDTKAVTWQPPANLSPDLLPPQLASKSISTSTEAKQVYGFIKLAFINIKTEYEPKDIEKIDSVITSINAMATTLGDDGQPLSQKNVTDLNIVSSLSKSALDEQIKIIQDDILAAIKNLLDQGARVDTSDIENQLAEELHDKFSNSDKTQHIESIKKAISSIKEYKGHVDKVAGWAKTAAEKTKSAKILKHLSEFGKKSKALGEGLDKISKVVGTAQAMATILGFDNQKAGEVQNQIAQMRAAISLIDTAMTFAKAVPLIGTLWSSYYKPLTEKCLEGIAKIAKATNRKARQLEAAGWFLEDMNHPRPPGVPPIIARGSQQHFPGGQSVFNYMYVLVNGGGPKMSPEVEKFFIDKKDIFNAGESKNNQITVTSNKKWYNPATWGKAASSSNLEIFLARNQDMVWSQLYGALSHDCKSMP